MSIRKEPIAIYLIRLLVTLGAFFFMAMLYWSSVLIEEDLLKIRSEMTRMRLDILQEIRLNETQSSPKPFEPEKKATTINQETTIQEFANTDSNIKSMLSPDPFYRKTLPKLLGEHFIPSGTFYNAAIGKPDNLHPFNNYRDINSWIGLCTIHLSRLHFGIYETAAPYAAKKIEERVNPKTNAPEFWIFLRNDIYWEPLNHKDLPPGIKLSPHFLERHQVTSEDYKFYFDAVMNPYNQEPGAIALRAYIGDIEEIEIIDPLTFIVRWKTKKIVRDGKESTVIKYIARQWTGALTPLASYLYKYFPNGKKILDEDQDKDSYRNSSLWAQNFKEHWAKNIIPSCGPWIFDGMTDRAISFKRNPHFFEPFAALAERIVYEFKNSPDTIWQDFKNEGLDNHVLLADQEIEYKNFMDSLLYQKQKEKGGEVHRLDYLQRSFHWIGWNQSNQFFRSQKTRLAMTLAIDRKRIIEEIMGGRAVEIHGTFFILSPSTDSKIEPWPYDPEWAKRLLEEEGWTDTDGDGIIDKEIDGKKIPFSFSLTYYVKNPTSKSIAEAISTQLKTIGVHCRLKGLDMADFSSAFDDKNFDALYLAWALGTPPETPRQLWYSAGAKQPGSSNVTGFANAEADEIIDHLDYEYDPKERIKLYHRFDRILHEEQPYTFLFTPKIAFLYRDWLQNVFLPIERQDLVPGANVAEPDSGIFWIKRKSKKGSS
jgi:peptide/nickel transport system substrate-binding protein